MGSMQGSWAFISTASILQGLDPISHTLVDDMIPPFGSCSTGSALSETYYGSFCSLWTDAANIFQKYPKTGSVVGVREKLNVLT